MISCLKLSTAAERAVLCMPLARVTLLFDTRQGEWLTASRVERERELSYMGTPVKPHILIRPQHSYTKGKENSREKTQKAHKSNLFCAFCAFSRLFHCLPSSGLLSMRVAYCKRLESSFPVLGPTRNVGKRRLAPSLPCASGFRELDAALAVTIFRQF
jgi:hypothetical protein